MAASGPLLNKQKWTKFFLPFLSLRKMKSKYFKVDKW